MNDFSGLCLNRSLNFTGCKDSIGQSHTRHRHRTEDYIDSQVLNLMLTVIEGVSLNNTNKQHIQEINGLQIVNLYTCLNPRHAQGAVTFINIPHNSTRLTVRYDRLS